MRYIVNTVKNISSKCSEINTSTTFNKDMTVCSSKTSRYEGDTRPIVKFTI
jgi:hypothetical protein